MGLCACVCSLRFIRCVQKKFQATSRQGRMLRYGMLTVLTNRTSTKVLWQDGHHSWDGHHPITIFSTVHEFGPKKFLLDNLQWKTPLVEDKLQWKTTFGERQLSVEDDLWWKTTFTGRRPLVVTPPLDTHIGTEPKPELSSAVSTGNRLCHRRKMYGALDMCTCAEKTTFLGKDS